MGEYLMKARSMPVPRRIRHPILRPAERCFPAARASIDNGPYADTQYVTDLWRNDGNNRVDEQIRASAPDVARGHNRGGCGKDSNQKRDTKSRATSCAQYDKPHR